MLTDDSIMTVAVGKAILDCDGVYGDLSAKTVSCMQKLGRRYPHCGYGGRFYHWIFGNDPKPYYSFGNGAAMRVSAVGFAARNIDEVKTLSRAVTAISHNHPEGLKGSESVAMAIFLARQSKTKQLGLNVTALEDNQKLQDAVLSLHHAYICSFYRLPTSIKFIENQNGQTFIINGQR